MPSIDILLDGTSIKEYVSNVSVVFSEEKPCNEVNIDLNDDFFYSDIAGDLFGSSTNYFPTERRIEVLTGSGSTANISQGTYYIEKPDLTISKFGGNSNVNNSIWGRNALAILDNPFTSQLFFDIYGLFGVKVANASTIVNNIAELYGLEVYSFDIGDYKIYDTWKIAAYPLDIISRIAKATNGYVRSTRDGKIWIKKHTFHNWVGSTQTIEDISTLSDISINPTITDFINRVTFSTSGFDAQNINLNLSADPTNVDADGSSTSSLEAVITDKGGIPVADGTIVNWSIDNTALGSFTSLITETTYRDITNEAQIASSHNKVSTEYPVSSVISVKLADGTGEYYTSGSSFTGSSITLNTNLPFNDSGVLITYRASGISTNILTGLNTGNSDDTETDIHIIVDNMRDTLSITFKVPGIGSTDDDFVTIVVKDRITEAVVPNATVTVDGVVVGQTDANGAINLGLKSAGNHTIQVTATGYRDTALDGLANDAFSVSSA